MSLNDLTGKAAALLKPKPDEPSKTVPEANASIAVPDKPVAERNRPE